MKSVGELSNTCSQIVLKCLYLARIGRPDILWSANKLTRSITKWTKACDKRLYRLISYIHHTCEYKQYCCVGNTAKQCRLGLFQDSDFARDLEVPNLLLEEHCAFLDVVHLFQLIGCARNKLQFRTDQQNLKSFLWSRLDLSNLIVKILHGNTHQNVQARGTHTNLQRKRKLMERLMI